MKRIKRRLAARDEMLVRVRRQSARMDLGDYYVLDLVLNIPIDTHVDLEDLGRELGALAAHERVATTNYDADDEDATV